MKSKLYNKLLLIGLILTPLITNAAGKTSGNALFSWTYENIILVISLFILLLVAIVMWSLTDNIMKYHRDALLREHGITPEVSTKSDDGSIFEKLYQKAWSLVPIDREDDIDLGHDYDGIRELDNSLPPWWLYLFYGTIIYAGVYLYIYQFSGIGQNTQEQYEEQMQIAEDQQRIYLASQANAVDESNVSVLTEPAMIAEGQQLYMANCAACHGNEGQGGVGPNFTDKYWIHGGGVQNIFKTIKYGVPEKGMISWKAQLKPASMQKLASYILTLEGTNPPNPKEPQGELYEEETK